MELVGGGGGLGGGGNGEFASGRVPPCRLVVTLHGLALALDLLRHDWDGAYKAGLFQGDVNPHIGSTVASLVPCDFSGYGGLTAAFGWTPAAPSGERAITSAHAVTWTHNGGPVGNWVHGYYVVDRAGELAWAERFCPAPQTVDRAGLSVRIIPTFYLLNEWPD